MLLIDLIGNAVAADPNPRRAGEMRRGLGDHDLVTVALASVHVVETDGHVVVIGGDLEVEIERGSEIGSEVAVLIAKRGMLTRA